MPQLIHIQARGYDVYVAMGSNLGDRVENLRKAVEALNEAGL